MNTRDGYIHVLFTDQDGRPLLLLVNPSITYGGNNDMAYIALSQEDTFQRIVTFDETMDARVIGTERDFQEATGGPGWRGEVGEQFDDAWTRVILPALEESPDE